MALEVGVLGPQAVATVPAESLRGSYYFDCETAFDAEEVFMFDLDAARIFNLDAARNLAFHFWYN